MIIEQITDSGEKQTVVRKILESLPEWFGIAQAREEYIKNSANEVCFAAREGNKKPVGFLCLKETGKDTVEISVMGVLREYHRKGVGRSLFEEAKSFLKKQKEYSFIQVKTVRMGMYEEYDVTNRFYLDLGFKEFEVLPGLWDENNPCQIYVMSL